MGKGRPNKERQTIMYKALKNAYETLLKKDKTSFPTWKEITEKANAYESIKDSCEGKIGDKTLEQSKNTEIKALRERIKKEKELFEQIEEQMPTQLSIRTKELQSSLEANVLLAQRIEQLEKTIDNKNNDITNLDKRLSEYENEIRRLRKEINNNMTRRML